MSTSGLPTCRRFVQRFEALVARGLAHLHGSTRQILDATERRGAGGGDGDLHVGRRVECDEVDDLLALVGHVAGRDVYLFWLESGEQLVPRHRGDIDGQRASAQFDGVLLVEPALEVADEVGGDAALAPLSMKYSERLYGIATRIIRRFSMPSKSPVQGAAAIASDRTRLIRGCACSGAGDARPVAGTAKRRKAAIKRAGRHPYRE